MLGSSATGVPLTNAADGMTTLFLDLETYSEVPITHGTHRYAEGAEIMVAAWAIDDGQVWVDDLTGVTLAYSETELMSVLRGDEIGEIVIHNSHFDRTVLAHNGIHLPVEKITDTMTLAMQHSLPGSLAKLCEILRVPFDQAKDKDGKRLINLFCKPRPKKQKLRRATRETHPEDWQKFLDYARLDIEAMRAVYKKLPKWNDERALWQLDQQINDRGVAIDLDLVRAAIRATDEEKERLAGEAQSLTDGAVRAATQRDAVLRYLLEKHGIPMDDLRASTVEAMLGNDNYPWEVRELLRVRLQASTASVAKYKALERSTSSDGRLRGTLQFCGAIRTGRWAGRLFQPQNLPRPSRGAEAIDYGIESLKRGEHDTLVSGGVMSFASDALRGSIIAPPGKKLVVADLSNIEGRVLAWLAGEDWKLQAFRDYDNGKGEDLYKITAGKILGKRPEAVTKKERQEVGKVAELALGYQGGPGAFLTFALAYGVELDALAAVARQNLDPDVIEGSAGAWDWMQRTKKNTLGLERETWIGIDAIKRAWRLAHPGTTGVWAMIEHAVLSQLENPAAIAAFPGRLVIDKKGAWLRIRLPSGRFLCYPAPVVGEGGKISYMGVNQYSRKWSRISTYGGKLVENITQAVARDVLAHGMLAAEAAGYRIVLSVHDELITETPDTPDYSPEGLAALMSGNPPWADGLPLAAAGFETYRYRKD